MKTVSRKENLTYVLGADISPVLKVAQRESFMVETEDNLTDFIKSEKDLHSCADKRKRKSNR